MNSFFAPASADAETRPPNAYWAQSLFQEGFFRNRELEVTEI
jgi:hypothetical protein